jgi:hypothetical protein
MRCGSGPADHTVSMPEFVTYAEVERKDKTETDTAGGIFEFVLLASTPDSLPTVCTTQHAKRPRRPNPLRSTHRSSIRRRRQSGAQKQLGADTAKIGGKIEELQRMLQDQNAKVAALAAQKEAIPAPAPAPAAPSEAPMSVEMMKLQLELIQQQKELELIKQGK